MQKRKVVVLTDGDRVAKEVVQQVAKNIGGRCISLSGGNPTPTNGFEIAAAIKETPYDPVLVMIDDCGASGMGRGERALTELMQDEEIEVLGVVAVASNTRAVEGIPITASITRTGAVIDQPVDKDGNPSNGEKIQGDTVDIVNQLGIPVIIGVGDLGKMADADLVEQGAKITTQAVQEVLRRSNFGSES